jgi:hypothetical protein
MALILDGTSGLSDVDGSAATPAIRGTDTNTGMFFPAADTIAFSEGGVEAMRIDSSGNVGIGTSSPDANTLTLTGKYLQISDSQTALGDNGLISGGAADGNTRLRYFSGKYLAFYSSTTERMRLDSSGNLGLGAAPVNAFTGFSYRTYETPRAAFYGFDIGSRPVGGIQINAYLDAAGSSKYIATGNATKFESDEGKFAWYTAPSGTAGNAITFTQAMTLDASGNLGIGTTSPASFATKLVVSGAASVYGDERKVAVLVDTTALAAGVGSGISFFGTSESGGGTSQFGSIKGVKENATSGNYAGALAFVTSNSANVQTERMRIDSSGNVGIGTASPSVPLQVVRNSQAALLAIGSAGTNATGTISPVTNCLTIGRSAINVPANTATDLVSGYGGNMLLISVGPAAGVADIQYTFVVTGGWSTASVLFSNTYGVNTATFTFSAVSGVTRVSHNHTGAINFYVHALTGAGPF